MIDIRNISFSYDKKQLFNNFSLNIKKGDKICLFGKSGCGKTTLLRLIMGLETVESGEIIRSSDLKFSCVFQQNLLLPFKTVLENITLVGCSQETAIKNLNRLGLAGTENLLPNKLSGGMQRRVAIARALSADFDVLILDEAFTGLDNKNIEEAVTEILNTAQDRPIILVSHSTEIAELMGAEIIEI